MTEGLSEPHVVTSLSKDWAPAVLESPKIGEGSSFTSWSPTRNGDAVLVTGCVATSVPGWVEDMRPSVEARTVALAGTVVAKVTEAPVDMRSAPDGAFDLRPTSDLASPITGRARTFVGFDQSRVFTCFAICASPPRPARACDQAVVDARLEGSHAPPTPGIALRSVTWAVHHPRPAALGTGVFVVVMGILAVVARRRPRFHAR